MIRKANSGDFGKLIVLWLESAETSHPFIPKKYWADLIEEMRVTRLPHSETSVYERDGRLVGFISTLDNDILALYV